MPTTRKPTATTPTPVAQGEIWQWALGRNVWEDRELQRYTHQLGSSEETDVMVQSQGFSLTPDGSGVVTAVTLFNDETALGLPVSESSFSAYQGRLPMGLTWGRPPARWALCTERRTSRGASVRASRSPTCPMGTHSRSASRRGTSVTCLDPPSTASSSAAASGASRPPPHEC